MSSSQQTLLVDCQVFQTTAWSRGMGRYLLSLLQGIHQSGDSTRVILICNANLELSEEKQELIRSVAPGSEIKMLNFAEGLSDAVEKKNTGILDAFVEEEGLGQDTVFLLASAFSFDYQPAFPSKTINTSIFYDMIPLKNWKTFHRYFPEAEYFRRYRLFYQSDKIYAISNAVKNDLIDILGFKSDDVVNIDGAEIPNFDSQESTEDDSGVGSPRQHRYVLLPGGNSPHKNMLRAIRAFDLFNAKHGDSLKLLITSFYSPHNQRAMTSLSPNIEICGEVSDAELTALFKHAEFVLFPSLDEGLGLPVLEAVGYEKKVACSAIPVFKEISKTAFTFFDPLDVEDIARAMSDASLIDLDDPKYSKEYARIREKFTWERSAKTLLDSISKLNKPETPGHTPAVSICIEQTGTMQDIMSAAPYIRDGFRNSSVQLFIDEVFEQLRSPESIPFIFHYFLKHRDIVDLPSKSKGTNVVTILTARSSLSLAVGASARSVILSGIRSTAKLKGVMKREYPQIPPEISERYINMLEKKIGAEI